MFALVDCNNFFVSCELVFRPRLRGTPVVVLSNNDGCVISRSNEAKALGIPMGVPFFKVRELAERHCMTVFSSNFQLYGDMSQRVMSILEQLAPEVEIYSIDEAFLPLSGIPAHELPALALRIRDTIRQWTGLPVSVGIAPSKTLAKIAADTAKKSGAPCLLHEAAEIEAMLRKTPLQEVWGIGRNLAMSLWLSGLNTAWDLTQAQDGWIRAKYSVSMLRKAHELRGLSCSSDDSVPDTKKSIICSRSFGSPVTTLDELKEAAASFAARAGRKLREQRSLARLVQVSVRTGKHGGAGYYASAALSALHAHSDDTAALIRHAHAALEGIFVPGLRYKKCGVMLLDFIPQGQRQRSLFDTAGSETEEKRARLHEAMDRIQHALGEQAVIYGAQGLTGRWHGRSNQCSPRYTTRWSDLLRVP